MSESIEPVRLAKRVAEMLACSRREAELYIEGGWITVDGQVIEEPQFRVTSQQIVLLPDANLTAPEPVTILFHQPAGMDAAAPLIGAENHTEGDLSGIVLLKRHFSKLSSTLPLEANASGLVVLTQDWRVSRKLTDNAATVEQEYVIEVTGTLSAEIVKQLNHRQSFNGKELPAAKVSLQSEARLRFALKGPRPGQIAHMCQTAGLQIVTMKRLRIGRIAMSRMPSGEWRYLPPDERF